MTIDKVPGAFWVALFTGIGSVVTVFLMAQYPENAPAWVAAALTACSVVVGLAKVLWPAPATTLPPAGVAAAPMAAPERPGKVSRFLF